MRKSIALGIFLLFIIGMASCSSSDVSDSSEIGKALDEAIDEALDTKQDGFLMGEFFSSAYHILQTDEDTTGITLYLLVTHGWYNRATSLEPISGCGIRGGVLRLTRENDLYTVEEYREYEIKQLLGSNSEVFPVNAFEVAETNFDRYYDTLKEAEQMKVIQYFGL